MSSSRPRPRVLTHLRMKVPGRTEPRDCSECRLSARRPPRAGDRQVAEVQAWTIAGSPRLTGPRPERSPVRTLCSRSGLGGGAPGIEIAPWKAVRLNQHVDAGHARRARPTISV